MSYSIKSYQPGFIPDQFEIRSEKYDKWRMGGQTRIAQLEQVYSQKSFDPETRFYVFKDNKTIAFLTSSRKADTKNICFFEFPFYKKGHKKASHQLIQHSFIKLKEKGFETLLTRAGPYWGNTKILADQYSFIEGQPIVRAA